MKMLENLKKITKMVTWRLFVAKIPTCMPTVSPTFASESGFPLALPRTTCPAAVGTTSTVIFLLKFAPGKVWQLTREAVTLTGA